MEELLPHRSRKSSRQVEIVFLIFPANGEERRTRGGKEGAGGISAFGKLLAQGSIEKKKRSL